MSERVPDSDFYSRAVDGFKWSFLGTVGYMSLSVPDIVRERAIAVELASNPNPSDFTEVMAHVGNMPEGFGFTGLAYGLLGFTKFFTEREGLRKITSLALSTSAIAIYEMGLISDKSPDIADIPAGTLGGLLFFGAVALIRRLSRPSTDNSKA